MGRGGYYLDSRRRRHDSAGDQLVVTRDGFTMNADGAVACFTDGACTRNGRPGARAGFGVFFGYGHTSNISEPVRWLRKTNNTAELLAILFALKAAYAKGFKRVVLYTDSNFAVKCLTRWLKAFKRRGWKTIDGQDVCNKRELHLIDCFRRTRRMFVRYVHTRRSSHPWNVEADRLAKAGARVRF